MNSESLKVLLNKIKPTQILRILLLFICIFLLYKIVDIDDLINFMLSVPPYVILLYIFIGFFRTWLTGQRWKLMNSDTLKQLSNWQYFRYMMLSNLFSLFMPGALGGDLLRSVLVVRSVSQQKSANLIAIIADRVIGLFSILILGLLASIIAPVLPERYKYLLILLTLIIGFLLAIVLSVLDIGARIIRIILNRLGKLGHKGEFLFTSLQSALAYYRLNSQRVLLAFLLCLPIHILYFIIMYIVACSIGVNVSFLSICIVTSIVWLITAIPLTFAGIGIRELSFVYLLSLQGVPAEAATALSLSSFFLRIIQNSFGIFFIIIEGKIINVINKT